MKKLVYVILFSLVSSMCVTACTDEEVSPNSALVGTQGKESDPL